MTTRQEVVRTAIGFLDFYRGASPLRIPPGFEDSGAPPLKLSFDSDTFSASWDDTTKLLTLAATPAAGSAPATRKLKTPSGSGLTIAGMVEADLSADRTLQVIVDPLSLKITSNQVGTLRPLSVTPDPGTLSVRSFTGDGGPAALHGQGALLAVRLVAGTVDDSPARTGALGVASQRVGVAFRNDADNADLAGLAHESGNLIVAGSRLEIGATGANIPDLRQYQIGGLALGRPCIAVTQSDGISAQSVTDGMNTAVQWDVEDSDIPKVGITHSTGSFTDRLTVTKAGIYQVTAAVPLEPALGLTAVLVSVYVNGSFVKQTQTSGYNGFLSIQVGLAASDLVQIGVTPVGDNTTIHQDVGTTWCRITRIAA